jgi:hypothetical protein
MDREFCIVADWGIENDTQRVYLVCKWEDTDKPEDPHNGMQTITWLPYGASARLIEVKHTDNDRFGDICMNLVHVIAHFGYVPADLVDTLIDTEPLAEMQMSVVKTGIDGFRAQAEDLSRIFKARQEQEGETRINQFNQLVGVIGESTPDADT